MNPGMKSKEWVDGYRYAEQENGSLAGMADTPADPGLKLMANKEWVSGYEFYYEAITRE